MGDCLGRPGAGGFWFPAPFPVSHGFCPNSQPLLTPSSPFPAHLAICLSLGPSHGGLPHQLPAPWLPDGAPAQKLSRVGLTVAWMEDCLGTPGAEGFWLPALFLHFPTCCPTSQPPPESLTFFLTCLHPCCGPGPPCGVSSPQCHSRLRAPQP